MKIHEPTHPHHVVWREYMESLLTGEPKTIEYNIVGIKFGDWIEAKPIENGVVNLSWSANIQYRIKPIMHQVVVNGITFEYPEPFAGKLAIDEDYYVVDIYAGFSERCNFNLGTGERDVAMGIVHTTQDAAIAHANVLRKICKL